MYLAIFISIVIFLILALPVKNWLEIKGATKKEAAWVKWVNEKPSKEEYCEKHKQDINNLECDFCGCKRIVPSLEMALINQPQFGMINNSFKNYLYFKSHICSQCNSDLFREQYED
jgi:hypothetical protein